jgi:hypothetical protein
MANQTGATERHSGMTRRYCATGRLSKTAQRNGRSCTKQRASETGKWNGAPEHRNGTAQRRAAAERRSKTAQQNGATGSHRNGAMERRSGTAQRYNTAERHSGTAQRNVAAERRSTQTHTHTHTDRCTEIAQHPSKTAQSKDAVEPRKGTAQLNGAASDWLAEQLCATIHWNGAPVGRNGTAQQNGSAERHGRIGSPLRTGTGGPAQ